MPNIRAEGPSIIQGVDTLTCERQPAGHYSEAKHEGWRHFHGGRSDLALAVLEGVLESIDGDPADRVQALYGRGLSHKFRRPVASPDTARESFLRITKEFPESSVAPWALLELGILARTKWADLDHEGGGGENDEARRYFRLIFDEHPQILAIHEAAVRLASSRFSQIQPDLSMRGVEILEEHLRRFLDNPLASTMNYRLAFWYLSVAQDYPKGALHLVTQGEMNLSNQFGWGQNYWQVAQFLRFGLKKPEEAILWYEKVIAEAPGTAMVLSSRHELAQLRREMEQIHGGARSNGAQSSEEMGSSKPATAKGG